MRADPSLVVVGGGYELTDAAGRKLNTFWPPIDDETLQHMSLDGRTPIAHPTAMMRRHAVEAAGGYDVALEAAEDNDLWLRLGEHGRLGTVPHVVLRYRQHPNSVSERRAADQARRLRIGCERAYARRGLDRVYQAPDHWRPTGENARYEFLLKYGWWAFKSAQRRTAVLYGLKAIRKRPFRTEPWTLFFASVFKPMPEPRQPPYHIIPPEAVNPVGRPAVTATGWAA
jgi:hypothetical protein